MFGLKLTTKYSEISDPDIRYFVRFSQIDALFKLAPFSAFISLSVIPVFASAFWTAENSTYLTVVTTLVGAIAVLMLSMCWYWMTLPKATAHLPNQAERIVAFVAGVLGLLLATMPATLFAPADLDQRLLIACTAAGLIATGIVFAPVPWAAFLYSGFIVAGSFIGLASTGQQFYYIIAMLLTFYAVFILGMIALFHRLMIKLALDQAKIDKQRQVISLLLYDFEEGSSDWLWETNAKHVFHHTSGRFAEVAGCTRDELHTISLMDLVAQAGERSGGRSPEAQELLHRLESQASFRSLVVPVYRNGEQVWWSLTGHALFDREGTFVGFRGVGSDVTETKKSESRIAYLARFDALTALPNRNAFRDELARAGARSRADGTTYAVFCLDLDGMKAVNDTFGHHSGDALLVGTAGRLRNCLREGDFVARLAGDEFAILADNMDRDGADALARSIIAAIAVPFDIGDAQVSVGVSIGIVVSAQDKVDDPLNQADLALYRAKSDGRGCFRFYESEMDARLQARRAMEGELRGALNRNELQLYFQPIINIKQYAVTGFEALLRWNNPTLGMVSPGDFIPIAEETGLIHVIGEWVIAEACRVAATWPGTIRIAVNLSVKQFRSPTLGLTVARALGDSGLAPNRLELEITESIFIDQNEYVIDMLHDLRALGVRIALDDFGTGYSSLSYLQLFPFDKIKIDQSFVRHLPKNGDSRVIIQAITMLATHFGMTITAEGVESSEQFKQLEEIGCGEVQGFLFSRPEPRQQIESILARVAATRKAAA